MRCRLELVSLMNRSNQMQMVMRCGHKYPDNVGLGLLMSVGDLNLTTLICARSQAVTRIQGRRLTNERSAPTRTLSRSRSKSMSVSSSKVSSFLGWVSPHHPGIGL